ncbi:hypothetical protein HKX48_004676 [Thoreauomyces humboldtii]|nr:hypothetical protein HKX48_004676 [Thoreauomyces humboldtii]
MTVAGAERKQAQHARQSRNRNRRNIAAQFNLLVAGHNWTGKSSFLKTLFDSLDVTAVIPDDPNAIPGSLLPPDNLAEPTPAPARFEFDIDPSSGERISLRVIDSPGIPIPANIHRDADSADKNEEHVRGVIPHVTGLVRFITGQFERTLLEESKVKRNPRSPDYQVHACLYFLDPQVCFACNGITSIDRYALEQLCSRVNVIVCLGKADLLTTRHLRALRNMVIEDLARYAIPVFAFPEDPDVEYDEDAVALNEELRAMLPFAIVNSEEPDPEPVERDDDDLVAPLLKTEPAPRILGRRYPWGMVEVENRDHCDFLQIKETLFVTHAHELKLLTRELYYEQWRTDRLLEVRNSVLGSSQAGSIAESGARESFYASSIASLSMDSVIAPEGPAAPSEAAIKGDIRERQMGRLRS